MYQADFYRKNNTCISCVFNGFKYTNCVASFFRASFDMEDGVASAVTQYKDHSKMTKEASMIPVL